MTLPCNGYAATAADQPLAPFSFARRDPADEDVAIDILYCGVCHSDLHTARNEWGVSTFPVVPGHEIIGRVTQVGKSVSRFKAGDLVGVGCMVDSCRTCPSCLEGLEQYCEQGIVQTYGSPDKILGGNTYGGYSKHIVVAEAYVLKVSDKLDLAGVAPLLCAGITTWSPLRHWNIGKGHRVGVVGLGGLGHMGLKFARAFGAHVVLFTTSPSKIEDAKRLGADEVVISSDRAEMKKYRSGLDFILNCVSAPIKISPYLSLLKRDGTMVSVGIPDKPYEFSPFVLLAGRRRLSASSIGGIRETQEMLDFCAEHGITADTEIIAIKDINAAYERMLKNDVKYRFTIDMATL